MLSSRYLHLHEALGLGPMWLRRGATVRPAAEAETATAEAPPAAAETVPAAVPPAEAAAVAVRPLPQHAVPPAPTPPAPQAAPAATAAETPRPASPRLAALLDNIRQRADAHAAILPEPPAESALQTAQRLWAARTAAAFADPSQLHRQAAGCTDCKLHGERKQALAGRGALPADVLVLSLNPALHDDDSNLLFSGSHGRLLDNMLAAVGLEAAPVFRTAWLRCAPRISLKPSPEELVACAGFLAQEWAWAQPKAVLLLGEGFRDEVQQWLLRQIVGATPCFILPHPAVLLRQPLLKAQAWPVLQALRAALEPPPQAT